jgi:hypothetical protein
MAQTITLTKSQDKVILSALTAAARFPGLRTFFARTTTGLTTGKIKSVEDVSQLTGIQKIIAKFTMSEHGIYRKVLEPIGFPKLGIKDGKITGFETKETRLAMGMAEAAGERVLRNKMQLRKRVVANLHQHIDFLQKESFFQKAHKQAKQMGIIEKNELSRRWYHNYALDRGVNYRSFDMLRSGGKRINDRKLGRMYFFRYKPNDAYETYDEYPLIFMLYEDADNFSGINFHYLTPKIRAILLGKMLMYLSDNDYNESSKLFARKFREVIRHDRRFRHARVSYRQYRNDQVQSKIIQVHPLDWELAIMVPTERFKTIGGGRAVSKKLWFKTSKEARAYK